MDWNPWQWLGFLTLAALILLVVAFIASAVVVVIREKLHGPPACPQCGALLHGVQKRKP